MRCLVQYLFALRPCSLHIPRRPPPKRMFVFHHHVVRFSFQSCPPFLFSSLSSFPSVTLSLSCGRRASTSKAKCFVSIHTEVIHTQIGHIITPWLRLKAAHSNLTRHYLLKSRSPLCSTGAPFSKTISNHIKTVHEGAENSCEE